MINDLLNYDLKIYQNEDAFKFSIDSVLLAEFVDINLRTKNIIDFCSGNAPIPMILSTKFDKNIWKLVTNPLLLQIQSSLLYEEF